MILNPYPWLGYDILLNLKIPSLGYGKFDKILVEGGFFELTQNPSLGSIFRVRLEHDIYFWIQVVPLPLTCYTNWENFKPLLAASKHCIPLYYMHAVRCSEALLVCRVQLVLVYRLTWGNPQGSLTNRWHFLCTSSLQSTHL